MGHAQRTHPCSRAAHSRETQRAGAAARDMFQKPGLERSERADERHGQHHLVTVSTQPCAVPTPLLDTRTCTHSESANVGIKRGYQTWIGNVLSLRPISCFNYFVIKMAHVIVNSENERLCSKLKTALEII